MFPRAFPTLLLLALALPTSTSAQGRESSSPELDAPSEAAEPDRWLAPDKAAHVFAGFYAAGAGYVGATALDLEPAERKGSAVATGIVAGLAKEAFDSLVQGERFSWRDLVADGIGIALFVSLVALAEP